MSNGPQKVTEPIFVNPPPEGLLNNAKPLLVLTRRGVAPVRTSTMERKKPIKKNHIKEFGGRDAPEASQGQTRDVPGTPGTFGPDLCLNQY